MYLLLKSAPEGLSHMALELEAYIRESGLEQIRAIDGGNVGELNCSNAVETELHRRDIRFY